MKEIIVFKFTQKDIYEMVLREINSGREVNSSRPPLNDFQMHIDGMKVNGCGVDSDKTLLIAEVERKS